MFNDYWKEAQEKSNPVERITINPAQSQLFNKSLLTQSIDNIPNMDDVELRKFISEYFNSILNNIFFDINESNQYIKYFTDVRFLDAFTDVLDNMLRYNNRIDRNNILKLNAICYDYIRLDDQKNNLILNKMLKLASIINRPMLPRLLGLGLSDNVANMILISRYSSIDISKCVRRVNFIIINQPKEIMNQSTIEQIFRIIYNTMNEWHIIFQYIMLDVLAYYDKNNPNTYWITKDVQEVDSMLSLAALDILEQSPTAIIVNTIRNYAGGYTMAHPNSPIRFSLRRLSNDYQRINSVVNMLVFNEGIYVP